MLKLFLKEVHPIRPEMHILPIYMGRQVVMTKEFFNLKTNRWLLLPAVIVLLWHSGYVYLALDPQYLFFICYPANLLLIVGIARQSGYLIGVGFGWVLAALPLWLYSLHLEPDWELSCALFHLVGLGTGLLAVKQFALPGNLWIGAVGLGLVMQLMARIFTDPALNINAAFQIYAGWETLFHSYDLYVAISTLLFTVYFYLLPIITNRLLHRAER